MPDVCFTSDVSGAPRGPQPTMTAALRIDGRETCPSSLSMRKALGARRGNRLAVPRILPVKADHGLPDLPGVLEAGSPCAAAGLIVRPSESGGMWITHFVMTARADSARNLSRAWAIFLPAPCTEDALAPARFVGVFLIGEI